jgi:hypothetical protein
MKIVIYSEGQTEMVLKNILHEFINQQRQERIGIEIKPLKGKINREEIKTRVELSLEKSDVLGVVVLCDVFPKFKSAEEAKAFLRECVGDDLRFHPHVAQYDFESWLIPFWGDICRKLKLRKQTPGVNPEQINDTKPPSYHIKELYSLADRRYNKIRDAHAILKDKDLSVIARACPEMRAFLNTLLRISELPEIYSNHEKKSGINQDTEHVRETVSWLLMKYERASVRRRVSSS